MALLDLDLDPAPRALRTFGIAAAVVFGGLGALAWHQGWIPPIVAYVAIVIAAMSLLGACFAPRANRPLYVALSLVAFPIGIVISYVVLGALFFLVLTPIGLVFRLFGRDALRLRPSSQATYWVPYEKPTTLERYFRQF